MTHTQSIDRTIAQALDDGVRRLAAAGIGSARLDARLLLAHATGRERIDPIAAPDDPLSPAEAQDFEALIDRRLRHEPISHLVGEREFWSLKFAVNAQVLDPRPDSETLVQAALELFPDAEREISVLDLGTGSGCLLLSVLRERLHAWGLGVDLSGEALAMAARNAADLELSDRVSFMRDDWGRGIGGSFDLVLCNPPYVTTDEMAGLSTEVAQFDPPLALDGGEDGLVPYRAILPRLTQLMKPDGITLFEIGAGQASAIDRIVRENGLHVAETRRDLGGIDRCMVVRHLPIFTKP